MIDFAISRPDGNPMLPDGFTAPTLTSECGHYQISPFRARGGIGWTLFGPGTCETFKDGPYTLRLADAILRADVLSQIDSVVDVRGLTCQS